MNVGRSLVILRYKDNVPIVASCSVCHLKFFTIAAFFGNACGQFEVKQAEVAPGHWDITVLNVDMKGKALFFKTIGVHEKEYRSSFRRVADDLTPAQAADILNQETVETIDRS